MTSGTRLEVVATVVAATGGVSFSSFGSPAPCSNYEQDQCSFVESIRDRPMDGFTDQWTNRQTSNTDARTRDGMYSVADKKWRITMKILKISQRNLVTFPDLI